MARLVTQTDINNYGAAIIANGQRPMQIGDIILFLSERNSLGNVFEDSAFPTARVGATYWIEGGVSSYNSLEIGSSTTITAPSTMSNPVHIHFFNGPGFTNRLDSLSLDVREFEINNFDHVIVDFETNSHPGLRDGWGSGRTGTFGFRAIQTYIEKNAMALRVENNRGTFKRLEIRGAELTMGSFAKLRASSTVNTLETFIIERCLMTRSQQGEGIYVGLTSGTNRPVHKNCIVRDNIFLCLAAEAIQLQQTADGTEVYNNVCFISGIDYRTPLQADQDTCLQIELVQGGCKVYNNIFFTVGKNCIQLFGRDGAVDGVVSERPVLFGDSVTEVYNNYIGGTKAGISARLHGSFTMGNRVVWRGNDIGSVYQIYGDVGPIRNYHYDMDGTVPAVFIGGKVYDNGVSIQNTGRLTNVTQFDMVRENVPEPEFINSGFDGIATQYITRWGERYEIGNNHSTSASSISMASIGIGGSISISTGTGKSFAAGNLVRVTSFDGTNYFYGSVLSYNDDSGALTINNISEKSGTGTAAQWYVQKRIPYTTNDVVILMEDKTTIPQRFYKCISAHNSHSSTRPDLDASKWTVIQWDANGKNSLDPAYNGVPVTYDFMEVAGDVRLVKNSYHHLLGRGLSCNEQRDDRTMYGWQWKETSSGTIRDIPGAYDITLNLSRYSYLIPGRYYRGWVKRMNSSGGLEAPAYSDWQLIS